MNFPHETPIIDYHRTSCIPHVISESRFAELIALECARLCEEHYAEPQIMLVTKLDDPNWRRFPAKECAELIKAQFTVDIP